MKTKTQFKGVILLLLTAIIWGSSFLAQTIGSENVPGFAFMGIRTLIGALFLLPFILIKDKAAAKKMSAEEKQQKKIADKKVLKYGMIIGIFLCIATDFQQFAFYQPGASTGKIAFITAMYMFFVPMIGLILFKKRVSLLTWLCVAIGFVGLYFLCFKTPEITAINFGDVLSLICALFFAFQILFIEKFAPECDGIKLSCIQFFTAGTISTILMFIFERPDLADIKAGLLPILYSGILSCGFAYTMQVIGQKYCEATIASLLMCMESVFATLFAALFLHESLSGREIAGCIIMFTAIVISQFTTTPEKN
ncbi:MAG: DMT family transporter [Treponema sp.]|nr:DMT family transporter [Treponema sp.]